MARREAAALYEKQKGVVAKLMKTYDVSNTGFLETSEIMEMLTGCNLELTGRPEKPTEQEVECLLALCDKEGDGRISQAEVLDATKTWCHYLHKGEETKVLLQKHDLSRSGKINQGELKPLLLELNEGTDVPDDVVQWVWSQADLTGDGSLTLFELTRAIAAWYVWLPEEQPGGAPGMLVADIDKNAMPEQPPPQPQSSCCTVS